MRARTITMFVIGMMLSASVILPGSAWAESELRR
jgi:hypothetical protein